MLMPLPYALGYLVLQLGILASNRPLFLLAVTRITAGDLEGTDVISQQRMCVELVHKVRESLGPGQQALLWAHNGMGCDFIWLARAFQRCLMEVPSEWLWADSYRMASLAGLQHGVTFGGAGCSPPGGLSQGTWSPSACDAHRPT
jgi:hypothetical protein